MPDLSGKWYGPILFELWTEIKVEHLSKLIGQSRWIGRIGPISATIPP